MPITTVTAQFVNQPKTPQAKSGSIKTPEGEYYGIPRAMLSMFSPGGTYKIEYATRTWQGREYKDVTQAKLVEAAPAAAQGGGGGNYRQTDDVTAERIFVCGAINAAIRAGHLSIMAPEDVTAAILSLRSGWQQTFGANKADTPTRPAEQQRQPIPRDDMNDEIPF